MDSKCSNPVRTIGEGYMVTDYERVEDNVCVQSEDKRTHDSPFNRRYETGWGTENRSVPLYRVPRVHDDGPGLRRRFFPNYAGTQITLP